MSLKKQFQENPIFSELIKYCYKIVNYMLSYIVLDLTVVYNQFW